VIICAQVGGCTDEEIKVGLTSQYVSKEYHVHRKQEGRLIFKWIIFIIL
jgi:hypothetical protein